MTNDQLENAASTARTLTTEVNNIPQVRCQADHNSCLTLEACRALTDKEKALGWTVRPYWAFDPQQLCAACAAIWHAERCAAILHEFLAEATKKAARHRDRDRKKPEVIPEEFTRGRKKRKPPSSSGLFPGGFSRQDED